ncbi:serine dehydratase-like [Crassostrea angulata]|uniref:serine dehydratase-like n=1 Tax=Magallana angulata TaxID=2784310 RepID=UPI0022B17C2C|nr:serine dehydratase-like [Crassostrea angulata]XP_052717623.1 serine dehydratase-like [Crassostrea angulata]
MDALTHGDIHQRPIYIETPAILSTPLSNSTGFKVYLKLENLQVPGSFKIRGIGNLCQKAVLKGCKRVVCASGGNGGLAAAYAARLLNLPATIVLPTTTPDFMAQKIREQEATVEVQGSVWDESNQYAMTLAKDPECLYVNPCDHPDIWEGHESLIVETKQQLPCPPDVVVASVGGGGLLCGVIQGMQRVGWGHIPVVAMETEGADCLNVSLRENKVATIPAITSVAKCLGALTPCTKVFELCQKNKVISKLCTDKQAINACLKFADDHRQLVEPACGASLAAVYSGILKDLQTQGQLGEIKSALIVVCGGSAVTLDALSKWKKEFDL